MSYPIYELKLKPLSPWITDLTADTIFGHLCWQIKYEFGKETLEEFLKEMTLKPIFTLSDVLPSDRLPRPLSQWDGDINMRETFEDNYISLKNSKKYNKEVEYIDQDSLGNYSGLEKEIIFQLRENDMVLLDKNKPTTFYGLTIENKNVINRNTGTTGDGGIYSQESVFFKENANNKVVRLLIKVIDIEKYKSYNIQQLLENVFKIGFGKKKSNGKGQFKVGKWSEKTSLNIANGNHILLLSQFIPSNKDSTEGSYKLITKFPKLGEDFSSEGQNFYKKPMVLIQSGATFKKENDAGYVGGMIQNVALGKENISHYAYGFTLDF